MSVLLSLKIRKVSNTLVRSKEHKLKFVVKIKAQCNRQPKIYFSDRIRKKIT